MSISAARIAITCGDEREHVSPPNPGRVRRNTQLKSLFHGCTMRLGLGGAEGHADSSDAICGSLLVTIHIRSRRIGRLKHLALPNPDVSAVANGPVRYAPAASRGGWWCSAWRTVAARGAQARHVGRRREQVARGSGGIRTESRLPVRDFRERRRLQNLRRREVTPLREAWRRRLGRPAAPPRATAASGASVFCRQRGCAWRSGRQAARGRRPRHPPPTTKQRRSATTFGARVTGNHPLADASAR